MTPAERALLNYLIAFNAKHGQLPTRKYIAAHFKLDVSVVSKRLKSLVAGGHIEELRWPISFRLPEGQ
jgi:DNA-binding MarR family transcriptional regulator